MLRNLADDPSDFPVQTAPFAGEPRTAGSVETPFQKAANRTAYLKDRLDNIDPTKEGVRRIRRVASIAALQALVDRPDKTIIEVDGVGLYQFDGESARPELSPMVVKPTAVGDTAPGRWLVAGAGHGLLDVPNGLARLDAAGRIPNERLAASAGGAKLLGSNIAFGLIDLYATSAPDPYSTTSSTYVDIPLLQPAFTMLAGDRVLLFGQGVIYQEDLASLPHLVRWVVVKPDASIALVGQEVISDPKHTGEYCVPLNAHYTAAVDGPHSFKLQRRIIGDTTATLSMKNLSVVALHVRP
jgi:hypothetical protein